MDKFLVGVTLRVVIGYVLPVGWLIVFLLCVAVLLLIEFTAGL